MPFDGATWADPRIAELEKGRAKVLKRWGCGWEQTDDRRWYQFWRRQKFCAGAVDSDDLILVLLHELGLPFGDAYDLYEWNDAPGRTRDEVVALYDRAITSLRCL